MPVMPACLVYSGSMFPCGSVQCVYTHMHMFLCVQSNLTITNPSGPLKRFTTSGFIYNRVNG